MIRSSRRESVNRWFLDYSDDQSDMDSCDRAGVDHDRRRPSTGRSDHGNRVVRRQPLRRGQRLYRQRRDSACPAANYYQRPFTNGGNWLDYLAHDLGVAAPVASLAGGSDYAFGGASTGSGTTTYAPGEAVPNVDTQIAMYLSKHTPTADSALHDLGRGE